jgi:hypothetical protein
VKAEPEQGFMATAMATVEAHLPPHSITGGGLILTGVLLSQLAGDAKTIHR